MEDSSGPLNRALERIGDRWSLLIIDSLQGGPLRFSDLSERVTGIAPNILSSRLSRLEGEGVISSSPYPSERPPSPCLRVDRSRPGPGRRIASARPLG